MRRHLVREYCVLVLIIVPPLMCVLAMAGRLSVRSFLLAVFLGSAASLGFLQVDFRRRNLWYLYDNLMIRRRPIFLALFIATQAVGALIASLASLAQG